MGVTYHYALRAPKTATAATLEAFLRVVEGKAKALGFAPTAVIDAPFDTDDQQCFARLLTTGLRIEHDSLKGVTLLDPRQVWSHDPTEGSCRVIPKQGVVLVVTDQHGMETVCGFLAYPKALPDVNGRSIVPIPDPRPTTSTI